LRFVAVAWHRAEASHFEKKMSFRKLIGLAWCSTLSLPTRLHSLKRLRLRAPTVHSRRWRGWFGAAWTSDVKDPQDGSMTHVENHITWAPNHQAINFVTDFDGTPHYSGFYAYDPAKKAISFFYTSVSGQLTIGTSTPDADGKTVHQEFDDATRRQDPAHKVHAWARRRRRL